MFNAIAKVALAVAERASREIEKHSAVCNELERRAAEQRAQMLSSIDDVRKDIEHMQNQFGLLRGFFVKTLLSVGGAAFLVVLGALGALTMFLLEHIDRLAK